MTWNSNKKWQNCSQKLQTCFGDGKTVRQAYSMLVASMCQHQGENPMNFVFYVDAKLQRLVELRTVMPEMEEVNL